MRMMTGIWPLSATMASASDIIFNSPVSAPMLSQQRSTADRSCLAAQSGGGVMLGFDGESQGKRLKDHQKCFEGRIPLGRQSTVEGFAADARLGGDRTEAAICLRNGTQSEQTRPTVVRIIERFHRRLEVLDGKRMVGSQFGHFTLMMRDDALQLAHHCLRFHSDHNS